MREKRTKGTTARQRAAVSLAFGIASTSCGAKTGLTTPCLVRAVAEKPEVVLVMDRSSSTEQLTRDGAPLIEAIRSAALRVVPQLEGAGELGLILFPTNDDRSCGGPPVFHVALSSTATTAVSDAIRGAQPFGMTPTYEAIHLAATTLRARATNDGAVRRRRFIVLVTDGGANCNSSLDPNACRCIEASGLCGLPQRCLDDERVIRAVRELRTDGIETIVIGLGAENQNPLFTEFLQRVAVAGGSTGYLSADDEGQIETVFRRSLLETSYCELALTDAAQEVPDVLIAPGIRAERGVRNGDGWDAIASQRGRLRLHGALCAQAIARRILAWEGDWTQRCERYP